MGPLLSGVCTMLCSLRGSSRQCKTPLLSLRTFFFSPGQPLLPPPPSSHSGGSVLSPSFTTCSVKVFLLDVGLSSIFLATLPQGWRFVHGDLQIGRLLEISLVDLQEGEWRL